MELILIAVVVVAVIAFIAYPLFASAKEKTKPASDALDTLVAQRDSAYDAIRDLDFDFQMGKLSQSDYEALRDKYRLRAAQALQQMDAALGQDGAETVHQRALHSDALHADAIEQEVTRLRARRRAAPSDAPHSDVIEQEVARLRAKGRCSNCGTPYRPGDSFCSKCGNKL